MAGGGGEDSFIQPLGFLLGLTALLALLLSYLGQSTIIAFIAVGVIASSLGVEPDATTLGHISEVGILILLFMAGLEVDLEAFLKNWRTAAIVGVGQIVASTGFFAASSLLVLPAIGAEVNVNSAVYFGLCLCFSSTILVLGYLKGSKSMGTLHGQLCLGTLVLQDAASVLGIAVLEALGGDGGIAVSVLVLFGKLLATMLVCFLLERFVLNRMFAMFARSLELLYLGALGYATGLAAIAVTAGFSGEITAFLAGVSLSRLPYKMHIETKMEPIKSLGVAIFFISLGLRLELGSEMVDALPIGFGLALFTLFATMPLFAALGVPAGLRSHTVFMLGMLMNQISEFSLILCTLCVRAYVFEPVVLTVMTVAAVVSIIVSSMGHAHIDAIYLRMQRMACLKCLDARRARKLLRDNDKERSTATPAEPSTAVEPGGDKRTGATSTVDPSLPPPLPLVRRRPSGLGIAEDWAFEDQLKLRTTEQLETDLKETEKELEEARDSMAATADEKKCQQSGDAKLQLYGKRDEKNGAPSRGRPSIIQTSHTSDIMHGMIEGYVVVDHELVFCTLRAGRMLFWRDQHDVGHAPPAYVWDVSGMAVLKRGSGVDNVKRGSGHWLDPCDSSVGSDYDWYDDGDGVARPWEWTIVLGHIHRHTGTSSIEEDAMKLAIHGLEGHSDHDAQDWDDALAVATSTLNPIALRLAHIREELHDRRDAKGVSPPTMGFESRMASNSHRNEIICIGYNEMFPAVLALADALGKDVVVVEYDPMKLNTVEKLYNEEKRRSDFRAKNKKKGKTPMTTVRELKSPHNSDCEDDLELGPAEPPRPRRVHSAENLQRLGAKQQSSSLSRTMSLSTDDDDFDEGRNLELGPTLSNRPPRRVRSGGNLQRLGTMKQQASPRRVRMMSLPSGSVGGNGFFLSHSSSYDSDGNDGEEKIKGVKCEYADIHDPECWEELEMDHAFMVVCTIKGARHAEKAILQWLRKQGSDAIFVACTQNNVDAMRMYKAGAHFVMQTDALAMRSTREIFLETVANFGDCSQLVAAGLAHKERLLKLQTHNSLKFQYETG
eukprot:CAMPEP_0172539054 /NCGR_PEP_ID=MMETSP1067-20121228/10331_1 /TAXON_ID=265564 ORGANISM="Thalassiosira punctigera, Strain Tpunct2005C2" /NCGR_SAMPLE_ID=MMETSP1067 /ASSEMBLY_ACC=CAM_ASM_000444 /LENGTH=1059 /DNA_ID=CAMNT_0013324677 /DNA_START=41 /DNA_END=3220 /DNA_ORIENTATION=-